MIADSSLRWICTLLFVFAAAYCVYRITVVRRATVRIDHGFHLAMCAAMIAMAWPWGLGVPLVPQGVFFAAATVWFAVAAARTRAARGHSTVDEHVHGLAMGGYHAFMMAAMVWMIAVMAGWLPGAPAHDHAAEPSMEGMAGHGGHVPGMDMSGHAHSAGAASAPGWISAVSLALTVAFTVAAIVWLYRMFVAEQAAALTASPTSAAAQGRTTTAGGTAVAVLRVSRLPSVAAACEVAMAGGMAIMIGAM
ncbi:DUF5134 domain-containing protein [Rhodococcus sp. NPDC058521]|uniref:DUF5134 domain-containing protein n=1 Tax=Rhodococcus sp. NPDC058521 TaxID=3346536 RepID=UPI003649884F